MRAWQIERSGPPSDALRRAEVEEPTPGPGELRLRVRAAAVGLPDAFMCRGTYAFRPEMPFVPGQEVCGVVDALGDGVDGIELGTRLMGVTRFDRGHGGLAESTLLRAESAFRVPDIMTDVEAAGFRIGYSTAWIGLVRRGAITRGEQLLVLGAAGGSGAAAVQVGRALGARVVAVASGAERGRFCTRLGADVVIDRSSASWPEAVLEATDGRGVDVVYDPVGGPIASSTVGALVSGGRLLAVGFASGEWVHVDTSVLVRRNVSLVGVYAGGLTRAENEADHEALLELAGEGNLRAAVTTVGFDQAADAVAAVDRGAALGKVVVAID